MSNGFEWKESVGKGQIKRLFSNIPSKWIKAVVVGIENCGWMRISKFEMRFNVVARGGIKEESMLFKAGSLEKNGTINKNKGS